MNLKKNLIGNKNDRLINKLWRAKIKERFNKKQNFLEDKRI